MSSQHVINMTGLDSGPVTTSGLGASSSSGGGAGGGSSLTHSMSGQQLPASMSASTSGSSTHMLPGAYRNTPSLSSSGSASTSNRVNQSAYAPLSPSQVLPGYASPSSTLTPLSPISASTSNLNRSQSFSEAAYQQMQASSQQQQQHSQNAYAPSTSSSSLFSHPPIEASPYRSRDRNQGFSESSSGGSLLPTINTQIPSTSALMASHYSPTSKQPLPVGSPYYNAMSALPSQSPVTLQPGVTSPYAANSSQASRPMSLYDSYNVHQGSSSRNSYRSGDKTMSPGLRGSPRLSHAGKVGSSHHLRASDGSIGSGPVLPTHVAASPRGDLLPLYSHSSAQMNSYQGSTYNQSGSGGYAAAPPRKSDGNYDPIQAAELGVSAQNQQRERRGTITSADAAISAEYSAWQRQKRLASSSSEYGQHQAPVPAPPKIHESFKRIRTVSELRPLSEPALAGTGRRADPAGGYVSPLKAMTAYLHHTYHLVNPAFFYELSFNPRRVLTKPSKPMHNDGHDNEDSDYILYVNDWLGSEEGNRYLILDILGQGTFGQVVKCQNMKTREIVAVKVIKNKPAYFNQSMMEVTILEMLNGNWDPQDEHHILRLRDTFIHAKHLCLVFELLSSNLYELIKQNSFRGLSTSLVRVFTTQLLDALTVLREARLIHCDLKPENILLKTLQTPSIKLVDFGSACHERQTVYTYIQSRFYRSPEVLLGLPYNSSIDMWSLGCIAVELFLGLPLFPGTSEYNQVCRIVEMLGLPPSYMLENGKQTGEFFNIFNDEYSRKNYKIKGLEQYSKEHNVQEQPSKRYFQATTLPDIIKTYPLARKSGKPADVQKEMANRTSFVDFVTGLLQMDPTKRWTPQQAKLHPFITGEKLTQPFKPPASPVNTMTRSKSTTAALGGSDSRHPYGGLPPTSSRPSGRAYQDAAAYNQHLSQQQVYNSAHQARQQQAPVLNNPYAQEDAAAASRAQQEANAQAKAAAMAKTQAQVQQAQAQAQAHVHAQAQAQAHAHAQAQAQAQAHAVHAAQVQAAMSPSYGQGMGNNSGASPYGTQTRSRSDTLTRMDLVPGQLAKLGIEGNHAMTPISSREEAMREYERRQQNGAAAVQQANRLGKQSQRNEYQQMDLLQQQSADLNQQGYTASQSWSQLPPSNAYNRMATSTTSPPNNTMMQSQPNFSVVVDPHQQHLAAGSPASLNINLRQSVGSPSGHMLPAGAPPSTYASPASNASGNRYQPGAMGNNSLSAFDPYLADVSQLMPTLQPTQYQQQQQGGGGGSGQRHSLSSLSTSMYSTPISPTSPTHQSLESQLPHAPRYH